MPIVIRMEGTNVEEGKRLLRESGMNFATADSMDEAANTVVQLANASESRHENTKTRKQTFVANNTDVGTDR